jgi:hypothetical protein
MTSFLNSKQIHFSPKDSHPPPPLCKLKFLACTCIQLNINFTNYTITAEEAATAPVQKCGNYGNHGNHDKQSNDN